MPLLFRAYKDHETWCRDAARLDREGWWPVRVRVRPSGLFGLLFLDWWAPRWAVVYSGGPRPGRYPMEITGE